MPQQATALWVLDCCRLDRPSSLQGQNKKGIVSNNMVPPGVQEPYSSSDAVTLTGWADLLAQNRAVRNSTKGCSGIKPSLLRKDFTKVKARLK